MFFISVMAASKFYLAVIMLLAITVPATWGTCEYTCFIADKDDPYGGCSLKMTNDDAKTKCMDCYKFCREYGEEESINGGSILSVQAQAFMMILINTLTALNSI